MVLSSLREGLGLLRSPPAWIPGLAAGIFAASVPLLLYAAGAFMAERIFLLELATVPFFVAGLLSMVKTGERSLSSFLSGGAAGYFRVMLPYLIILFAIALTILLVLLPLYIIGAGMAVATSPFVAASVTVTILFFTYFSDTAAVIEGRRVFDSVRRSVEFVLQHVRDCIVFYLAAIAISFVVIFVAMVAWTSILYERVLPLASMTPAEIQSFTADRFTTLLGFDGIVVTAVMLFIATAILFPIIICFKAYFFRDRSEGPAEEPVQQGEYDSKGRWYKY